MAGPPYISVIIVNYNGEEWLEPCVQSVADQSFTNFECFIVDNNSTDKSLERLPDLDSRFHLIKSPANLGFAAGNNLAAKRAKGKWLALLNPDAFAHKDWLEKLLAATELAPNVTMVGSTQYFAYEDNMFDGIGDELHAFGLAYRSGFGHKVHPVVTRETFAPCGAGALLEHETFQRLGGFDETFFCYHEDIDLAYRMRLDGGICIQSADAKIDHVSSGISGRASDFAIYHGTRNRVWTFMKNTPRGLMPLLFPGHILMNILMLIWSIFRSKRAKPTWRGMKDGFLKRPRSETLLPARKISYIALLKSFAWSPIKLKKRAPIKTAKFISHKKTR